MTNLREIPIGEIAESPTNPRRRFDDLDDLADSIREVGILEPLLVRPRPMDPRPAGTFFPFELVCGARRLRAARLAGVAEVPAMVRELDDGQVLELQLVENNQRSDITPVEEAHAFGALARLGRSAEDIAVRIGRSVGYVRSRLRLLDLTAEVRALLEAGRIHVGSALLLAQVSEARQREVATRLAQGIYRHRRKPEDPYTTSDVAGFLSDTSRRVSLAVWPLDDDELVPTAGACTICPRRTGSQRALLAEMEGEDQCLDAACWASKAQAAVASAQHRGELVLAGPLFDQALDAGAFFDLDADVDDDDFEDVLEGVPHAETWREALARIGATPSEWTLAVDHREEVLRLVSAAHLATLVESHWPEAARVLRLRERTWNQRDEREEPAPEAPSRQAAPSVECDEEPDEEENAKQEAERDAARLRAVRERQAQLMAAHNLAEAVVGAAREPSEDAWRALVGVAVAAGSITSISWVAERRGLADARGVGTWCLTATEADLRGLLFELIAAPALASPRLFEPGTVPAAEHGPYGIDRLFDAIGVQAGRALKLAKKRLADEERAAEKAAKKAADKASRKRTADAKKAREVRDGGAA